MIWKPSGRWISSLTLIVIPSNTETIYFFLVRTSSQSMFRYAKCIQCDEYSSICGANSKSLIVKWNGRFFFSHFTLSISIQEESNVLERTFKRKNNLWSCHTFYQECNLQLCAVLFQKVHMVWNSNSTFHQFWVKREEKNTISHFTVCWLTGESCKPSLFSKAIFQLDGLTSSKCIHQLCQPCWFFFSWFLNQLCEKTKDIDKINQRNPIHVITCFFSNHRIYGVMMNWEKCGTEYVVENPFISHRKLF